MRTIRCTMTMTIIVMEVTIIKIVMMMINCDVYNDGGNDGGGDGGGDDGGGDDNGGDDDDDGGGDGGDDNGGDIILNVIYGGIMVNVIKITTMNNGNTFNPFSLLPYRKTTLEVPLNLNASPYCTSRLFLQNCQR